MYESYTRLDLAGSVCCIYQDDKSFQNFPMFENINYVHNNKPYINNSYYYK
jgi:hypothetical protein